MTIEDWNIENTTGYTPMTTCYSDFSIAEKFGTNAIKDTYNELFNEWQNNVKYMTELTMALNWKCWRWYEHDGILCGLYLDLYNKTAEYCCNHFEGDDLSYYYQTTD